MCAHCPEFNLPLPEQQYGGVPKVCVDSQYGLCCDNIPLICMVGRLHRLACNDTCQLLVTEHEEPAFKAHVAFFSPIIKRVLCLPDFCAEHMAEAHWENENTWLTCRSPVPWSRPRCGRFGK